MATETMPSNGDLFYESLIQSYVNAPRFVERSWLAERIEAMLAEPNCRFLLLTAEPGAGKTAFMAWLAHQHPNWCRYFIRRDQRTPLGDVGAHSFLLQVGFQLAAVHPDLFQQDQLKISVQQRIGTMDAASKAVGAEIDKLFASPFYQKVIQIQQEVDHNQGNLTGIRIGEWYADNRSLPIENLEYWALIDPAITLRHFDQNQRIVVLVDALDELRYRDAEKSLLKWLADCPELPSNIRFILTSRPDDDLLNSFRGSQQPWLREMAIKDEVFEEDFKVQEQLSTKVREDLSSYAGSLVQISKVKVFLEENNQATDNFVKQVVDKANGNFGYLDAIGRAVDTAILQNQQDLLKDILKLSELPNKLQELYAFFLGKIKDAVGKEMVPVEVTEDEIGFVLVWSYIYKPILGILSVAREPLTPTQIQKLGLIQTEFDYVTAALERLRQFLDQLGNSYRLYHSTLPEFFTSPQTKDRTDYSYCYVDAVKQNQRIARYYSRFDNSFWASTQDLYALRHLPLHLRHAKEIKSLCNLLRGNFSYRQMIVVGPNQTQNDCFLAIQAAAQQGLDQELFLILERSTRISREVQEEWESGRYVQSLLIEDPALIKSRGTDYGGELLPWTSFLAAERLLDLGLVSEACEMLRELKNRIWPNYQVPLQGKNLLEGSNFDFILNDGVINFLAKVAPIDPSLSLALTQRLYIDSSNQLPNVRTAWRDVLRAFLEHKHSTDSFTFDQCKRLAKVTCDWLNLGGHSLGWAGLTQAAFELLVHAVPVIAEDSLWFCNAVLVTCERRFQAKDTVQGASDKSGLWACLADICTALVDIDEAISKQRDVRLQELQEAIKDSLQQTLKICPPVELPEVGGYSYRAGSLGRLAIALYEAESEHWKEYAEAALIACSLDGTIPDPPMGAIVEGLRALHTIPETELFARTEALIEQLNLREAISQKDSEDDKRKSSEDFITKALIDLPQESNTYKRSRIALAIWRYRKGSLQTEIEVGLNSAWKSKSQRSKKQAKSLDDLPVFTDLMAEALANVLNISFETDTSIKINRLNHIRTPKRQQERIFLDHWRLSKIRWQFLAEERYYDLLRKEVEIEYQLALTEKNAKHCLDCCLAAIDFDLNLADQWYELHRNVLTNPIDRGEFLLILINQLERVAPEHLDDLGEKWIADLPQPEEIDGIAFYQLMIFKLWDNLPIFRNVFLSHLHHILSSLPAEAQQCLSRQNQENNLPDLQSFKDLGYWLGGILDAVGALQCEDDEISSLVWQVCRSVEQVCYETTGSVSTEEDLWTINRNLIEGILEEIGKLGYGTALPEGSVADWIPELFTLITSQSEAEFKTIDSEDKSFDYEELILSLRLAIRLRKAKPEWSKKCHQTALNYLSYLLEHESLPNTKFDPMFKGIIDAFITVLSEFSSKHEQDLFNLVKVLVDWCTKEKSYAQCLSSLQSVISRIPDLNKRYLLLSPIAKGWLELHEWNQLSSLLEHVTLKGLVLSGFYEKLSSVIANMEFTKSKDDLQMIQDLVLKIISITPLEEQDAFFDTMVSWLSLRAINQDTSCYRPDQKLDNACYLNSLTDWLINTVQQGLWGSSSTNTTA